MVKDCRLSLENAVSASIITRWIVVIDNMEFTGASQPILWVWLLIVASS
jgi:hypothetical protein